MMSKTTTTNNSNNGKTNNNSSRSKDIKSLQEIQLPAATTTASEATVDSTKEQLEEVADELRLTVNAAVRNATVTITAETGILKASVDAVFKQNTELKALVTAQADQLADCKLMLARIMNEMERQLAEKYDRTSFTDTIRTFFTSLRQRWQEWSEKRKALKRQKLEEVLKKLKEEAEKGGQA